jgi:hypothetical protein
MKYKIAVLTLHLVLRLRGGGHGGLPKVAPTLLKIAQWYNSYKMICHMHAPY